jgi:hypothetical protein
MTANSIDFVIQLVLPPESSTELDQLTAQLRAELLDSDVVAMADVIDGDPEDPHESSGGILDRHGGLAIRTSETEATGLFSTLRGWLNRQRGAKIRIQIGDTVLEFPPDISDERLQMLLATFTAVASGANAAPAVQRRGVLTASEREQLRLALMDAFDRNALVMMLREQCSVELEDITTSADGMPTIIAAVIYSAEMHDWINPLIEGAVKFNPTNRQLQAFYTEYKRSN